MTIKEMAEQRIKSINGTLFRIEEEYSELLISKQELETMLQFNRQEWRVLRIQLKETTAMIPCKAQI
jgi:hypothetical protein